MKPSTRKMLGNIFLVITIIVTTLAIAEGGLCWAAVTVSAALALWGINGAQKGREEL